MLEVTCPLCDSVMKSRESDKLVRQAQAHSARAHGGMPTAQAVMAVAKRCPEGLGPRVLRAVAHQIVGATREKSTTGNSPLLAALLQQAFGNSPTIGAEQHSESQGNTGPRVQPTPADALRNTASTPEQRGRPNLPPTGKAGQPASPGPQQRAKLTEAQLELERLKTARRLTERLREAQLEAERIERAKQAIQTQAEDLQAFSNMQNMIHQMRMGVIRNIHN